MIPVFSLVRQHKELKGEFGQIFQEFLQHGIAILGPKVKEFEKVFAEYIGVSYAVGVASGTDAITLALLSLGIGQGDEVIVPANCYPSVFGVAQSGAIPCLVDIDPETFTIEPEKIERAITKKTKAILPVHLYGNGADMGKIMEIAKARSVYVVEDCAQAVGAQVKVSKSLKKLKGLKEDKEWRKVGSIGDIGCFSFYPTKNLGALGDGGMVVTNNPEIAKKVRLLRMYGEKNRYESVLIGTNSRLDELQAAILLCKMKYLEKWNQRRREIAKIYQVQSAKFKVQSHSSKLKAIKDQSIRLPQESHYGKHIYHLFVIRAERRDELKAYLEKKGIQTAIHYPVPIHLVPSFKFLGYKKGDFPQSEKAAKEVLSLPMFPELRDVEVERVAKEIRSFCEEK